MSVVYGNELEGLDSQLMHSFCHEENATQQEEPEVQSEKIYVEAKDVSILDGQIFACLSGLWEAVTGLYSDEAGLYVQRRDPHCPRNLQRPLCPNDHLAVRKVFKPNGEFHRFLCEYHTCQFEYHDYRRNFMPPGYYMTGVEK